MCVCVCVCVCVWVWVCVWVRARACVRAYVRVRERAVVELFLLSTHNTRDFPAISKLGTRQWSTHCLGEVEKDAVLVWPTAIDNFRGVVHTCVGCSTFMIMPSRHQVTGIFFGPSVWTSESGRNHQFRWSAGHMTHGTRNVVVNQRLRVCFRERVVGVCLVFRAVQIATRLKTWSGFRSPFGVSVQTQIVRATSGVAMLWASDESCNNNQAEVCVMVFVKSTRHNMT